MSEFRDGLKVEEKTIYGKPADKFDEEMNAYRRFISESLPGFIVFMEAINSAINSLEDNLIMSDIQFKARIKDAIGAVINSSKKPLDDMFGMEIIAPDETAKEVLMLLIHRIYDEKIGYRVNNHNKSNGYRAHHRIGSLKKVFGAEDFTNLEYYILNAKTRRLKNEYRDIKPGTLSGMTREQREELYEDVPLYPKLAGQIREEGALDESIVEALQEVAEIIKYKMSEIDIQDMPITEIQFKTTDVAQEAIFGKASHVGYKPVNEQEIIYAYNFKKLMRGMHFPFKFQREDGKMRLQQANTTLLEMYPFLRQTMLEFKKQHPTPLLSFDMHFATIFPELKPYVAELKKAKKEQPIRVRNPNPDAIWKLLKLKALNPDFSIPEYVKQETNRKKGQGQEV